jgi:hypothetical protein
MDSGLQPDPPPDAYEKKIRIGCGALLGICIGLYAAAIWFELKSAWAWVLAAACAVFFARMELVHGHHFWFNLLRIVRATMRGG